MPSKLVSLMFNVVIVVSLDIPPFCVLMRTNEINVAGAMLGLVTGENKASTTQRTATNALIAETMDIGQMLV